MRYITFALHSRYFLNMIRAWLFVIIAGLRHILSLHFTVLINFDEYWICF